LTPSDGGRRDVRARELRWSDFDDLRETYYLLYDERETNAEIGIGLFEHRPTVADEVTWFANLYRKALTGDAVVAVGEVDGRAVGSCVISRVGANSDSEQAHFGTLGILVHRDHRGQGVGRAMLARALAESLPVFDLVQLTVLSVNVRARRLYEEFGFRAAGRIPRALRRRGGDLDEEIMMLDRRASPDTKH
jgi:RimJ/RimL family protein N-acetyltransferase